MLKLDFQIKFILFKKMLRLNFILLILIINQFYLIAQSQSPIQGTKCAKNQVRD